MKYCGPTGFPVSSHGASSVRASSHTPSDGDRSRKYLVRLLLAVVVLAFGANINVADASIAYVQSGTKSIAPASAVTVTYGSAQAAGDLNVVVVSWIDTNPIAPSVTDTKGNVYTAAIGPIHYATGAQAIYYAKNIVAGSNAVTVTFSASVNFLDVRTAEYSGIDTVSPLDGAVGATGTAISMSSGALTTTNANDLLVAGNYLASTTTAPGAGYTRRQLSSYSSILEDRVVNATGSYAGTATQNATGWWDMQMAAFKAASGAADTTPPSVPTSFSATATSSSQINLGWAASTDNVGVTGYLVERCQGASCTTFAQIATPTATSYSDTGLTTSTSYSYRVRTTDAAGNLSAYSSTASATTSSGGPASIAYVLSGYRSIAPASTVTVTYGSAQAAGDLNVVVVSWIDTSPIAPSVTDTKGNVYTAAIGPIHYATGAQAIYYAKNIVAGSNAVTVTFSASVNFLDVRAAEYSGIDTVSPLDGAVGATGSAIAMSSGALTTTNANDLLVAGNYLANTTTAPGAGYTQRELSSYSGILEDQIVSATGSYAGTATQNATGWWDMQMAAFKRASGGGDTTPPSAPTNPSATATSSSQINLTWAASTDNVGVTGYLVERCQGASCTTFAQIATPTVTSYSDTGLAASTSYSYRVRATDAAGNLSGYSGTSSATTSVGADTTPPSAPTSLSATATSSSQINLTWTASTDNVGVTGYLVERCQGASCTTFAQIATPTTTSYSDTGLTASTSYSYQVRATDAAGNLSGYSSTSSATTQSAADTTPPSTPSGLSLTVVSSIQINLNWTASTDNVGVTGYRVERCPGASRTSFTQIAAPTATSYSDTGLTASTSYSYRVRAADAAGNLSGYSGAVSATTTSGTKTSTYTYDANGRLSSITTSAGTRYYHYDPVGNVASITSTP
jgi:YD repeat-containing protein